MLIEMSGKDLPSYIVMFGACICIILLVAARQQKFKKIYWLADNTTLTPNLRSGLSVNETAKESKELRPETFQKIESQRLSIDNCTETNWDSMGDWAMRGVPTTKNTINAETKKAYYGLLKDIHEILTNIGIKYVLGAGTLLGSYRHGDIIPWDDDGDICIRFEDHERLAELRPILKQKGIELQNGCLACWSGLYSDVCKYLNDRSTIDDNFSPISMGKPCRNTQYFFVFKRGDVHIDVFHLIPIYDKQNRRMYTVYGRNRLISEAQAKAMFNVKKCPFGPLSLNCPSNTKELLCHQYKNNLQFPTLEGINNKDIIPGMWSGKDEDTAHFIKDNNNYIIKNFI